MDAADIEKAALIMLTAYLDESYDPKVFCIGGCIAWKSAWTSVEKNWNKVIRQNSLERFHAADCNNGFGEFSKWPSKRRTGLVKRLIKVLTEHQVYALFSAVVQEPFREIANEEGDKNSNISPYMLCFQHCVQEIALRTRALPTEDKVDLVVDTTKQSGRIADAFKWMKYERKWEGRERLGELLFASWQDSIPLQAADLIAYENFKHLKNSIYEPQRQPRKAFQVLFNKVPLYGGYFDRDALVALSEALGAKENRASTPDGPA